jgi:mycothiol system anti-sigma-R factor
MTCEQCRERALSYLDGRLSGADRRKFQEHLAGCEPCKNCLEQEEHLSQLLLASRATDGAPEKLRVRVQQLLESAPPPTAAERLRELFRSRGKTTLFGRRVLAGTAVALVLCVALIIPLGQQVLAGTFIRTAVGAHHSYEDGKVPLEINESTPALVTAWIQQRVPFHFRLPEEEHSPNQAAQYRLSGASILDYKKKKVALVVYQMQTKTISLLVAPADSAILTGGEEVQLGKLTFHYRSSGNLQVVTWSNHGLAYALVSPQKGSSAQASCLVCHEDMADRGTFMKSGELQLPKPWKTQ